MGGVASTLLVKLDSNNRRKFAIVILSGPIASLLFAIICFICIAYGPVALRYSVGIQRFYYRYFLCYCGCLKDGCVFY
jgi:hypothetical protein